MLFTLDTLKSVRIRTLFLIVIFSITQMAYANSDVELKQSAQNQDPVAQYQLAQSYELGTGTPKNMDDAIYWYQQSADSGHSDAQFKLAKLYAAGTGVEQNNQLALEWFIKAALQGNKQAPLEVAKIYEDLSKEKHFPQLQPLDLALLWYEVAVKNNPAAEQGYNRVLEAQFNQQRAKQISSIEQLNDNVNAEANTNQPSTIPIIQSSREQVARSNLTHSDYLISAALAVLIAIISIISTLVVSRKRYALEPRDTLQQQQSLKAQLNSKDLTIKQQKRQLHTMFHELKKQKNSQGLSHLQVACALFGYTPSSIPDQKSIKFRYKQLSKIYHPDGHGCDEEMKRLNNALKTILQNVT
ncbi:J domain-containing protein [Vibrio artabrorum]|uniref:J domain-containing protein n=1 Tax=Vibrio artabrorum TaxID=446374 RepID=UPI003557F00D